MSSRPLTPSDPESFVALQPGDGPGRFRLPVVPGLSVGDPAKATLFGGAGLGAGIAALERTTGKPVIWAAAQFLSFAFKGELLDVQATVPAAGHHVSQGRAMVSRDGQEILTVLASLGRRPPVDRRQWTEMPDVPPPEDCVPMPMYWRRGDDDMYVRLDSRAALGWGEAAEEAGGRSSFWIRPRDASPVDRPFLAILGDFLPAALSPLIGKKLMTSLDNAIRFIALVPTRWVLCETQLYGIDDGIAHGRMLMFAEDGTLMAAAAQSVIVRARDSGATA